MSDVEHVHQPAGQGAELLRAGADAAVHGGAIRGRELAGQARDLAGLDSARARGELRREVARQALDLFDSVQVVVEP